MGDVRGGLKALEYWAKKVTAGYKDVNIKDMSTSFRDGLAFCAIIHHYRPDLIDFESLSKENIYKNNSLAFSTAEKQLGVPALLDAEDMEKYSHPDRLSIITYLSQLRNCFENQNKVNKIGSGIKRINKDATPGPPVKVPIMDTKILPIKRHENCQTCKNRVFILERLIVDGKLYHRTCFRCNKCDTILNPGAYIESDTPGLYECSVCIHDEKNISCPGTPASEDSDCDMRNLSAKPKSRSPSPLRPHNENNIIRPLLSSTVTSARNKFLQDSLKKTNTDKLNTDLHKSQEAHLSTNDSSISSKDESPSSVSVKDKISVFESSTSKASPLFKIGESPMLTSTKLTKNSEAYESTITNSLLSTPSQKSLNETDESTKLNMVTNNNDSTSPFSKNILSLRRRSTNDNENTNNASSAEHLAFNHKDTNADSKSLINLSPLRMNSISNSKDESDSLHTLNSATLQPYSNVVSRDIFQNNIKPLKLNFTSISQRRESFTKSRDIKSYDENTKLSSFDIPQIKSSNLSLPRPKSYVNLSSSEILSKLNESHSQNNISEILHNRWSKATSRRSSLESSFNSASNIAIDKNKTSSPIRDENMINTSENLEAKVHLDTKDITNKGEAIENKSDENISNKDSVIDIDSNANTANLQKEIIPIPKPRSSLSKKSDDLPVNNKELSTKSEEQIEVTHDEKLNTQTSKISVPKLDIKTNINEIKNKTAVQQIIPKVEIQNESKDEKSGEEYPDDLNPFGDEEASEEEYPDDLNPFGDEDEDNGEVLIQTPSNRKTIDDYDESKNPFASDDDDDQTESLSTRDTSTPILRNGFGSDYSSFDQSQYSCGSSPSTSLRGTTKKRRAPQPPKLNEIFANTSLDSASETSFNSLKASPSPNKRILQTPSPKLRKNKPAPPPPPTAKQNSQPTLTKELKDMDNMKIKSVTSSIKNGSEMSKQVKKKKRPAPPVPIPKQKENKKIPLKEIIREMKEIEEKQKDLEKQGREIELLIRDRDKDEEPTVEEEENIMQLFELVNQKNALFRRQAELMYIKRSQRLEEQQDELTIKLRVLNSKPEEEKTQEEKELEADLMLQLLDVIDQRNSIIDSIEMDRRRELEEDFSVNEQMEIKNGDLPIAAELKEKSKEKSSKEKKSKNKKDKKKKEENGGSNSGKNTLKRKWLSKKLPS